MLLDICLGTRTSWKILFVLGEAPGKAVSRKEIKNLTKLGNKTLTKFLLLYEKFEIINTKKIGKSYYYNLNLANPFTEKILETINTEKKQLNNPDFEALNVIREFVYEITNINIENINKILLFGSHAKRTSTKDSDIDLAIMTPKKDVNSEILISEIIEKIKERFGKEIQAHYFTDKEYNEGKKGLILEIKKDGIKIM